MSTQSNRPMMASDMTAAAKAEFGKRLSALMIAKGWNESELARQASDQLPKLAEGQMPHRRIGRVTIGLYAIGRTIPNPVYLEAIAKALDVTPEELVPVKLGLDVVTFIALEDGRWHIRINRTVSTKTAMAIKDLLRAEGEWFDLTHPPAGSSLKVCEL